MTIYEHALQQFLNDGGTCEKSFEAGFDQCILLMAKEFGWVEAGNQEQAMYNFWKKKYIPDEV